MIESADRAILDYSIQTGGLLDPAGRIVVWNRSAAEKSEFTAAEAFGRPFDLVFAEAEREDKTPQRLLETARRTGAADQIAVLVPRSGRPRRRRVIVLALGAGERGFVFLSMPPRRDGYGTSTRYAQHAPPSVA